MRVTSDTDSATWSKPSRNDCLRKPPRDLGKNSAAKTETTMQHNKSPNESKRRKQPFCWIEKPKLRMIDDVFSENTGLGSLESARSIYLALAEIASDYGRDDNLEISQAVIARRAGVCVTTVKRILPTLVRLKFLKVKRNSVHGMMTRSTYTLVRGEVALSNKRLALGKVTENGLATLEEHSEECFEGSARKTKKCVGNTCGNSLVGKGDGFNPEKGEYEW